MNRALNKESINNRMVAQMGFPNYGHLCFVHPIFRFWFLVTYGNKVTKIRKYYVIFVYILQGMIGKTEKNQNENHTTKVGNQNTENQKTIIWDEQNITVLRVAVIHATFSQYQQTPYQGI